MSTEHIIVGMSGGVDSSVTAITLLEQGYRVSGLFMKNWDEDDGSEYCTARQDLADAAAVAETLGIELHTANFAAEYWDNVFEHFLQEYAAGRTPNPDILCNREIKFKVFRDYASALGADGVATGHYARLLPGDHGPKLAKGLDSGKDQSYFLHAVAGSDFSNCLFPLGEMEKSRVRRIAADHNLVTHDKKDSTGICFIGERRFKDFLQRYLPAQPGVIEDVDGDAIGEHQGLMYYTMGQRQGLGIGGLHGRDESPWYVVEKDLERNVLIVGQGSQHPALFSEALGLSEIHWIDGKGPTLPWTGAAKIRYRQSDQGCHLERREGGFHVRFDHPQRAVTPGQYCVFYDGDTCLGGAVIESRYE